MATTIDWPTKVISVYRDDLTHVSGTIYRCDTNALRKELKQLEASEAGRVYRVTQVHNDETSSAGITYARVLNVINGFQVRFLPDEQWSVVLIGSNNNIFDVEGGILAQNQVQVIPNNAAGLQTVTIIQGSAVTPQDKTDIANAVAALADSFKDKNTEIEIHAWLDSYVNKGDWKADAVNLSSVLTAISNLNNLSLTDIENSLILAKETSLTSLAAAIADLTLGTVDLTPVLTAISNLNNVTPAEVRAAFDAADFKDSNTETEIHTWLDSYPNKTDWKAAPQDVVTALWEEIV